MRANFDGVALYVIGLCIDAPPSIPTWFRNIFWVKSVLLLAWASIAASEEESAVATAEHR